jgi:outer membrane protein OmpA-like peptidoglycan-associated protein
MLLPVLFVGCIQAQTIDLHVELMNQIGTDVSRKGDMVSGRVMTPSQFQGDIVEGKIMESKSGARQGGSSILSINFNTLRHGGTTVAIKTQVKSVVNSQGTPDVDEEGRMVRRGSTDSGRNVKGANIGSRLGGLFGGGKGATIGSLADTAAGALVDISSDSPNINFNPGSRFILASTAEGGGSLASLAPNQPAQPAPATTVSTAPAAGQSTAQAQTASAQASTSAAASQQPELSTLKSTFIPGEKTIFYDDFTDMGPDDAPPHFKVRGPAPELRGAGNTRQLTVVPGGRTILSPNLTALPANFTFEAELACETGTHRADIAMRFYSKNKVVFELDFFASDPTSDLVAQMKEPYSELGRKNFNTKWNEPGKLALWLQNGRLRIFFKDEKQLDFNQVEIPPIDKVEIEHGFSGANAKSIGYRMVRFAESTPDFSQMISSSGRYVTHGILFDTDSDRLKTESAPVIQLIARGLENNPNLRLLIEGHTDSVGNADHNLDLSLRRAEAVKSVLVGQFNIDAARLSTAGLGATKPIDTNDTPQGRAQNRRVELVKQ